MRLSGLTAGVFDFIKNAFGTLRGSEPKSINHKLRHANQCGVAIAAPWKRYVGVRPANASIFAERPCIEGSL
jgi:hypothetical protein